MSQKIAFFDFDGTITTRDTLLEIIRFHKGTTGLLRSLIATAHYTVAYKSGIISNQRAKEQLLRYVFGGLLVEDFLALCEKFQRGKIPALIREGAVREIKELQQKGWKTVIVSASPENWITGWASELNMEVIATRLQVENGKVTGLITEKNCHGEEKVCRINKNFDLSLFQEIRAYGDTKGDLPMLALAHESFYKPFRNY